MITEKYSFTHDGKTVKVFALTNGKGMEMVVTTFGGRIVSLTAPDRNGKLGDVIVGYEKAEDYATKGRNYMGALIGRFGNRIGGSRFTIDGKEYRVVSNERGNTLHGGKDGFDVKVFDAEVRGDKLVLSYRSPDGEEGFPGNLDVKCAYSLDDDGAVTLEYEAVSDKATPVNLTNHAYFNIGDGDDVLGQILDINASKITPVDDELIPHGEFMDVDGTPFSFKGGVKLGKNMFSKEHMIDFNSGFDFNYCLDRKTADGLEFCASVLDPESGRYMECFTTLPGVQLYTSNRLNMDGKKHYGNYAALCLETQGYPNSPNCPEYPSTVVGAGETYRAKTVYRFSTK